MTIKHAGFHEPKYDGIIMGIYYHIFNWDS